MGSIVSQGIVLSRTDFGEADRIITVLTPDQGRIRLIAKGVRKIKSKLAGGIELFSISDITFIKGRGEIDTLVSSRLRTHFSKIVSDIDRTMFGYKVLKKINKTVEDNAGREYFDLLAVMLDGLNHTDIGLEIIEIWFNCQLLKLAGHSPNLSTDTAGVKLSPDNTYNFDLEKMAFVASPNGRYTPNHIKLLRLSFSLESPIQLANIKDVKDVLDSGSGLVKALDR